MVKTIEQKMAPLPLKNLKLKVNGELPSPILQILTEAYRGVAASYILIMKIEIRISFESPTK